MTEDFKKKYSFEDRLQESTRIVDLYPQRIPVIIEKHKRHNKKLPEIDKRKYLIPSEMTVSQFMFILRKRMNITADVAIFLFIENSIIPPSSSTMEDIYAEYKNKDGFIYFTLCNESYFG